MVVFGKILIEIKTTTQTMTTNKKLSSKTKNIKNKIEAWLNTKNICWKYTINIKVSIRYLVWIYEHIIVVNRWKIKIQRI